MGNDEHCLTVFCPELPEKLKNDVAFYCPGFLLVHPLSQSRECWERPGNGYPLLLPPESSDAGLFA